MSNLNRRHRRDSLIRMIAMTVVFTLLLAGWVQTPASADRREADPVPPAPKKVPSDAPPANGGTGDSTLPQEICFGCCGGAPAAPPPPPPPPPAKEKDTQPVETDTPTTPDPDTDPNPDVLPKDAPLPPSDDTAPTPPPAPSTPDSVEKLPPVGGVGDVPDAPPPSTPDGPPVTDPGLPDQPSPDETPRDPAEPREPDETPRDPAEPREPGEPDRDVPPGTPEKPDCPAPTETPDAPETTDEPERPAPPPSPAAAPRSGPRVGPSVPTTGPRVTAGPSGMRGKPSARRGPSGVRGQGTVDAENSWSIWWELNRWRYLPQRTEIARRAAEGVTGADPAAAIKAAWDQQRVALTTRMALPFLWKVLNPASDQPEELRTAALIGMGRVARNEAAIDLLLHYAMTSEYSEAVRQAAIVGLGHIRRTNPQEQFAATRLDLLRIQLLRVFDHRLSPTLIRAKAILAIGMLGDQPHGSPMGESGEVVTRELWRRLAQDYSGNELPVALLTAIGMQPKESVPNVVREGLAQIALGKRVHGQRWSAAQRSHALTTRVRVGGAGTLAALSRVLASRRAPEEVRRAGFLALGSLAASLDDASREDAFAAWKAGEARAKDPLTRGLGLVALGRLLGADIDSRDGDSHLLYGTDAAKTLEKRARSGDAVTRGFAVLGLSIAARGTSDAMDEHALAFGARAERQLLEGLVRGTGDDHMVAAYAVGLGLVGSRRAVEPLTSILRDRARSAELRGRSAVALAQIGGRTPRLMTTLRAAMMDRRDTVLRQESALALSFLGQGDESKVLVADLERGQSQFTLTQIARALGHLGRLEAVPAMLEAARNAENGGSARSYAVAAMGLILNPEELGSLNRVRFDANYPSRTRSLHDIFHVL